MKIAKMLTILVTGLMVWPAMVRGAIDGSGTSNHIPKFINTNTLGDSAIYETYGRASIGTTNPQKGYRLTVDGGGKLYGIFVRNTGDVGIESIGSNYGLIGRGRSRGVSGASDSGFGVYGKTADGYAGYFEGGKNYFEGNVGIGITNPSNKLDVAGNVRVDGAISANFVRAAGSKQVGPIISCRNGPLTVVPMFNSAIAIHGWASGTNESDTSNIGGHFLASGIRGRGVYAKATNKGNNENYGGYFEAAGGKGRGIYAKGGTNGYAAEFHGNVIIKNQAGTVTVLELGQGLDYAEGFDVSQNKEISPGSVLVIDPDNIGRLMLSNKSYDSKVAGIVAGAKEQGSGVRLGAGQFDYDVALAGRVYCNVDATEIAVQPGDLLTTSAIEGYAMKATDYIRAQGAILGKAMEKLEKGKKAQILVLVTLQ